MISKRKEHGMEREREMRENWKRNATVKVRRKKWLVLCEIGTHDISINKSPCYIYIYENIYEYIYDIYSNLLIIIYELFVD